jgi:hypothetical protein
MTTPRRLLHAAATAAAVTVVLTGCSTNNEPGSHRGPTWTPPSAPTAPSGEDPYATPETPRPADPLPAGSSGTPRGAQPTLDAVKRVDATAVSGAALRVMWSYDTRHDTTAHDASVRLADTGLCTKTYAETLREHAPRADGGTRWSRWTTHHAYTSVELKRTEEAGRPKDTATTAYRQWTGTLTPHGQHGWRGEPVTSVAFVELSRGAAGGPWLISAITLR